MLPCAIQICPMIPLRLLLVIAIGSGPVFARSRTTCVATTPVANQSRTKLKHRPPGRHATPSTTSIPAMLNWKAPAKAASSATVRRSNSPIDPKESEAFTVEGDLWRVVVEANDCDLHLELSAPGAGVATDRVIVEVPQVAAYAAVRQAFLTELARRGATVGGPALQRPVRLRVTGFAFYDGFHFSNGDPQRGHEHGSAFVGTLWEIHPVWRVEFE